MPPVFFAVNSPALAKKPAKKKAVKRTHSFNGILKNMTTKKWGMTFFTAGIGLLAARGVSRFVDGEGWFSDYVTADNSHYLRAGISLGGAFVLRHRMPVLAFGMAINGVLELFAPTLDDAVDTEVSSLKADQAAADAAAAAQAAQLGAGNQVPGQQPAAVPQQQAA